MNYIAHIYWRSGVEREKLLRFRVTLGEMGCDVGEMKDNIEKPHLFPRYDIFFTEEIHESVTKFLHSNFNKMTVVIRRNTGNTEDDLLNAVWTGKAQTFDL